MRGYESGQFGSFEGLDNRRTLFELFHKMGHGLNETQAAVKRADFLKRMLSLSANGFSKFPVKITPCSANEAYFLLVSMATALGVSLEEAALKLEQEVRGC